MIYSDKISEAIIVSARAHEGQYRKGSTNPYVEHPFSVALISQKYIDDEEVFIAALLHDILEDVSDKKYSRTDMQRDFGANVLGIVEDVTEPDITEPTEEAWLERKQSYIDHLAEVSDIRPLIVSTADKIHNMSEIIREYENVGSRVWDFFNVDRKREIWFYDSVLEVLKAKVIPQDAIEEYEEKLTQLKKLR